MGKEKQDADVDDGLDLDTGEVAGDEAEKSSGGNKKLVIVIGGAVILMLIVICAYFMLSSADGSEEPTEKPTIPTVEVVKDSEENKPQKALYAVFENDFIATLVDKSGKDHHMVIAVTVLVRDPLTLAEINKNKPLLSNHLLELFESQKYESMQQVKHKEELRKKSLIIVNDTIKKKQQQFNVDAILFTKFMMD